MRSLAPHEGRPVIEAVLAMVADWDVAEPAIAVFGSEGDLDDVELGTAVAVIDEAPPAVASAISVGLDAATRILPDAAAALIVDGDVPGVPAGTAASLISEWRRSGSMAAAPQYRYVRSGPVLVGRQLWDRIMASESEQRLVDLLAAHPEWTSTVVISDTAPSSVA